MLQTAARAEQRNVECILWFHPFIQPTINNLFEPFSYFGDYLQFCANITQAEKVKVFEIFSGKKKICFRNRKSTCIIRQKQGLDKMCFH